MSDEKEPLPWQPRTIQELIGRRLTWFETWRFRLICGGREVIPYWLRVGALVIIVLPPILVGCLMEWIGHLGFGLQRAMIPLRDRLAPERVPWDLRPDESRNMLENERARSALAKMGLYPEDDK